MTWDPVADFHAIQAVWSLPFLIGSLVRRALRTLAFPRPGHRLAALRVLLATAGRRGEWREAAPPSLPRDPVAEKALAELRARIDGRSRMVSLDAEPALFWFTIAASLAMSVLMALLALRAVRMLRSSRKLAEDDFEDQGVLHEIGEISGRPR